jgi:chorismate--pyruvate lyase
MTRWKRPAPFHSDPWRPWLAFRGSLTWRILQHCRRFEVKVVSERLRFPNEDEYRAIGRPAHKLAFVREVLLYADGRPVVMAHSIISQRDLRGVWRSVAGLGTRPLAQVLFADRTVRREPFEFARIEPRHPLGVRAGELTGIRKEALHARRSLFRLHGRPLMVTEVFLPALLRAAR